MLRYFVYVINGGYQGKTLGCNQSYLMIVIEEESVGRRDTYFLLTDRLNEFRSLYAEIRDSCW